MISATHVPGVLRLVYVEKETERDRTEVVCYIRAVNGKIEINYSHHVFFGRSGVNGPWSDPTNHRYQMEPSMATRISYMAFHEIWSVFASPLKVLPTGVQELDTALEKVKW